MKIANIETAVEETKRFARAVNALRDAAKDDADVITTKHSAVRATVTRASLDLSKALATMRNDR